MSTVIENNTVLLSEVPELREMPAVGASLIVNDSGTIKQYNYSHIATEFSELKESIGSEKTDTTPSTGLYLQVESVYTGLNQLNNILNGTGSDRGLINTVNSIQEDLETQQNKKVLEGYNAQFIESSDNVNLLIKDKSYDFTFPLTDLVLSNCIRSGSGYEVNLYLNLQYEKKDVEYYLYNTAVINLNIGDNSSSSRIVALYLPGINANMLLEFIVSSNNLRIKVKDCPADSVKENSVINVEYGAIEIKKTAFVDSAPNDGPNNEENNSNIINIPLTLRFDSRDALNSNSVNTQVLANDMLYGTKIKFDQSDIQQGVSMIVKYDDGEAVYQLNPADVNSQIKYIGNNLSSRGNVLTLNESGDLLPAPQVVYFNTDQSATFGIAAGTWFKYWPDHGQITNLTFNKYNYNGGINHQIKYEIKTDDERINIDGVSYIRVDNSCIPDAQWQAFFTDNNVYKFNLICKNIADEEIKLTECNINDSVITIKSNNNTIIKVLNYQDETSNTSAVDNVRPGIYLKADMKNFIITTEIIESN